jgi:hypothetical protein
MEVKHPRKNHPNFYELALILADGQARNNENGETDWESFIDNLARISNEFATQVHTKEKPWSRTLQSDYDSAYQV